MSTLILRFIIQFTNNKFRFYFKICKSKQALGIIMIFKTSLQFNSFRYISLFYLKIDIFFGNDQNVKVKYADMTGNMKVLITKVFFYEYGVDATFTYNKLVRNQSPHVCVGLP